MSYCIHYYENVGAKVCPYCGNDTHEIDFEKENKINREWLKRNPDAWKKVGWWSI
jgi:hypothetical protein